MPNKNHLGTAEAKQVKGKLAMVEKRKVTFDRVLREHVKRFRQDENEGFKNA